MALLGNPVKQAFEENKQTLSNDSRKYSIATYNLSAIYRSENNESKYLENLILSAMADIRSVNGDIGSLQEIAEYLFKHGEIDRAYNYILYCSQKAMLFHNRVRIVKMSHLQNQIYKAYQEQSRTQQKRLQASLIAVSFLFLVLIGAFLFIRKPEVVRQYGCPLHSTSTPRRSKHAAERPEYAITGSQRPVAGI